MKASPIIALGMICMIAMKKMMWRVRIGVVEMVDVMAEIKVGDKVRVRTDLEQGVYGHAQFVEDMLPFKGKVATVTNAYENEVYNLYDCGSWQWSKEMLEPLMKTDYPQDAEENEYRYISPGWLDELARGLTKGAEKHPGETWRTIPTKEHLARAMRHINLYLMGDRGEPHLINASMRLMMAFDTSKNETGE